jgi:hypothetical protein
MITVPGVVVGRVPDQQKCAAAKIKAAGKKTYAEAKCRQKAITKGGAVDPDCLSKAGIKFQADIAKADAAGPCSGDAATLDVQADACVDSFVHSIQPSTTTTAASTTTTSTLPATFGCCQFPGSGFCAWTTAESCTESNGVPGDPGSVCDSATGSCTLSPAIAGGCCTVTIVGPPSGSACFAGPGFDAFGCSSFAQQIDPNPHSVGTLSNGVCPSPGSACVP